MKILCQSTGDIKLIFRYWQCFIIALTLQDRLFLLLFPNWPTRHTECAFHQSFRAHLNLSNKQFFCCLKIWISKISTCTKPEGVINLIIASFKSPHHLYLVWSHRSSLSISPPPSVDTLQHVNLQKEAVNKTLL